MAEPRSLRSIGAILTLGVVGALAAAISWYFFYGVEDALKALPPESGAITAADAARFVELKNVGLAQIENEDFAGCDAAFAELSEKLPAEAFGPRNLTVARLLNASQIDANRDNARHAAALKSVAASLETMKQREGDTPAVHVLTARWAAAAGDEKRLAEELALAAEKSSDDPTVWFEIYNALKNTRDDPLRNKSQAALKRAFRLRPENLHLLIETLQMQARAHDPTIVETLSSAKQTVKPFVEAVQQRNRIDLLKLLDEAAVAAAGNDEKRWGTVTSKVTIFANLLRPEVATRLDLRRINRHTMEFLLHDFSDKFPRPSGEVLPPPARGPAASSAERATKGGNSETPIHVRLVPAPQSRQLPPLAGVQDVVLADFDLDGKLDAVVARDKKVEVYGQGADGGWKLLATAELPFAPQKLVAVDLDRDFRETPMPHEAPAPEDAPLPKEAPSGAQPESASPPKLPCLDADVDVIAYGDGGAAILRNRPDAKANTRALEPVAQGASFDAQRGMLAAAVGDFDHDGDLDIVFSRDDGMVLWSNRDNFTFEDASARSALPPKELRATQIIPVDWDRNIDLDMVLCGPTMAGLLQNIEHGRFRWLPFDGELATLAGSAAIALLDADGNASWDAAAAGPKGIALTLTATRPAESIRAIKQLALSETPATGLATWDYDNGGYLDLLAWSESEVQVFRGGPNATFAAVDNLFENPPGHIRGCRVGDVDGDGDEDVLFIEPDRLAWYENDGGNANHWVDLAIRAEGNPQEPSERCNIHGIGSLLELKAGPVYQARVVTGRTTHFGLGKRERPDVARVLWTNGIPHNVIHPAVDQAICEQQQLKGSCPYLYTWTGSQYEFFTDCLWNAPIGLQFAEGVLAPAREWEYLTIPGDRLVEVDGEYRMQMTEELWEATYFDQVKLIAVDHPADVEIYSNEKVGPAEIAQPRIHTVRHRRLPVAARDKNGRDILPLLAQQDRKFVKAFDGRMKQGLVDEHFLELDLGDLKDAKAITLFLTGWIFPTDVTVNISVSQNPDVESPRPPSLWLPSGDGRWKQAIPFIGFPGGKTKTMAVDLTGLFPANDYRVRIVTSNEIYWDAAFFTADEAPAEVRETELPLVAADLHYRGFSKRVKQPDFGPEWYDYTHVEPGPLWPPMLGNFTRYGDVTELLAETDDCLAIIGAGDEMTLRFKAAAQPPPAGWKRDFLLYNVGWDKDADLNTVYGQTVEPLPFAGMSGYPHDPANPYPDSPRHRSYLEKYQTRVQSARDFWQQVRQYPTPVSE